MIPAPAEAGRSIKSAAGRRNKFPIPVRQLLNKCGNNVKNIQYGVVEKREKDAAGKAGRKQLEIDFIANRGSQRYYIQSAFAMPDEKKREQEKMSLLRVKDSFKKIIVVKDIVNVTRDENGITTMSVYDFLLKDNSLELYMLKKKMFMKSETK